MWGCWVGRSKKPMKNQVLRCLVWLCYDVGNRENKFDVYLHSAPALENKLMYFQNLYFWRMQFPKCHETQRAASRCFDQPSHCPAVPNAVVAFSRCSSFVGAARVAKTGMIGWLNWRMDSEYSVKVKSFASYKCLVSPSPWVHVIHGRFTLRSELRYCTRFCCLTDFLLVLRVPALAALTWMSRDSSIFFVPGREGDIETLVP